jgi:hypothetical protein
MEGNGELDQSKDSSQRKEGFEKHVGGKLEWYRNLRLGLIFKGKRSPILDEKEFYGKGNGASQNLEPNGNPDLYTPNKRTVPSLVARK